MLWIMVGPHSDTFCCVQEQGGEEEEIEEIDKVTHLKNQVDGVKQIMTQNVDRILARGERLDDLMDKSEDLQAGVSRYVSLTVSSLNLVSPLHIPFLWNRWLILHTLSYAVNPQRQRYCYKEALNFLLAKRKIMQYYVETLLVSWILLAIFP